MDREFPAHTARSRLKHSELPVTLGRLLDGEVPVQSACRGSLGMQGPHKSLTCSQRETSARLAQSGSVPVN